tara:strand:- start:603 stop:944 length:342 start_codon:yes stop_codon:yes gene_type:complete
MDFKTRLLRFYELRCPSKCSEVDKLAIKYKNKEKELFRQLTFKYGPEQKLTNADKTAIQSRTLKKSIAKEVNKEEIDYNKWMDSLLDEDDIKLISELDNYSGKSIPQSILDKI